MVGIVVVSHSPQLAGAAVDLALQMVPGDRPALAVAAGTGDGAIGTDAVKVGAAISEVASTDGVLVMMDLGSAVLSAEMALDLLGDPGCEVRLCSGPFVEGLLAAVVTASSGATLDVVYAEALAALAPKQAHLGHQGAMPDRVLEPGRADTGAMVEVDLVNPLGLHARPAATLVQAAAAFDARIVLTNVSTGRGPASSASMMSIIALGAERGHRLRIEATGPEARAATLGLRDLVATGFGEV
jgi:dihydroxyacetone kinase phosphotransfer subunit